MTLKGFRFSAVEAAIKKPGRKDLALIVSETPATAAAVFTTNAVKAAPVLLSAERIAAGYCQALVVNSGNANACTGAQGMLDARETSQLLASGLGIAEELVQVSSTGVYRCRWSGSEMPCQLWSPVAAAPRWMIWQLPS